VHNSEHELTEIDRAAGLRERGDIDGAIGVYTELLKTRPRGVLYFQRGTAYSEKGDFRQAVVDLTKALELNNGDTEAYANRGNAYLQLGEFGAAIRDYDKVIQLLSPTLAYAFNGRGVAFRKTGRTEDAIRDLIFAGELDPSYASPDYNIAEIHFNNGQFEQAVAYLERASRIDPKHAGVVGFLGQVYAALRRFEDARNAYLNLVRLEPNNYRGHRLLAWLLSTCPNDSVRDGPAALAHAKRACEITNWSDPLCIASLAAAHAECGDYAEAVKWQKQAVARATGDHRELAKTRLGQFVNGLPIRDVQ
jgi:tetratricopeptide (TPR) repeat protein